MDDGGVDDFDDFLDDDVGKLIESLERKTSKGDFNKKPVEGGPKIGTVHFVDRCIVEPQYKKTLLAIAYYEYDCDDAIGDVYVKDHIQTNFKNILSKEKKQTDQRVKIAKSLGYLRATRRMLNPHYFDDAVWDNINKYWEFEKFHKASENGKKNCAKKDMNHKSGAIPFSVRRAKLDSNLETPMTNLEFFKHVYNIEEPVVKNIMVAMEVNNPQEVPEAPQSPASKRKHDLYLLMQARKPKKNKLIFFPRNTLSELLRGSEASRLNAAQSTQASQFIIPEDAYSIIRRVLSEVTNMVKSIADNQVPRTQLSKMLEKLATEAFPDRANPVQQSAWDQYIRIANEVIGQVMRNYDKIIMELFTFPLNMYIQLADTAWSSTLQIYLSA
ncbi:hypothetical protein DCAR_0519984 [Daucus carota subsp. sativus]|uniref:Uncharacterized protein n=1 Tax=Daucus carota subsp. sativus TaxID=79200 RepID=A0AAF0X386_DAUCS|nr:hypothetical protein DCAR_0519984 [Daucus carota subsp. sativus]